MSVQDAIAHIGQALQKLGADEATLLGLEERVAAIPPAPDLSPYALASDVEALAARVSKLEGAGQAPAAPNGPYAAAADVTALAGRVAAIENGLEAIDPAPSAAGITISPISLGALTAGVAASILLSPAGGTAPYSASIAAGALPDGLTLAPGGLITGAPTTAGAYDVTVQFHDANGVQGEQEYTGTIGAPDPAPAT